MQIGLGIQRRLGRPGGLRLPNLSELIGYYKGLNTVIDLQTYLKSSAPSGSSAVAQIKGVSVLFDGTGYGTLIDHVTSADTSITLSGDSVVKFSAKLDALSAVIGSPVNVDYIRVAPGTTNNILMSINSVLTFFSIPVVAGIVYEYTFLRVGSVVTVFVDDQTDFKSVGTSDVTYSMIGKTAGSWTATGNIWGIYAATIDENGVETPVLDLNMLCGTDTVHPDIELSATPGLPNCEWASFAAGIYAEHTDGNGFDPNAKGWTVADGATMYLEVSHTNLLLTDSRIPPGAGFDASGDPLITQYQGPIAANLKVVGIPCLLGDGTGYAAITGLLTTDVITVPTGSSQPTCTTNGVMNFVNTEKPFHITVTRASTVWAFYPCEAGEGTVLEDTINANNGTLTSFIGDPWSTRDVGECLMVENGFSIDRLVAGTGVSVCKDDGLHQDDSAPTYPHNTMSNTLNAPVLHEGALGPLTQGVTLWTAEAQVDVTTLPANTADQTLLGDKGMVIYDTAQSADDIAKAVRVIGALT